MYNIDDSLLYVGISNNFVDRFQKHKADKPWWMEISTVTMEHFNSRKKAEAAELSAIKKEKPKYNIKHNEQSKDVAA